MNSNILTTYIGRNVYNVHSDLQQMYPDYDYRLIAPNEICTMDYQDNRVTIIHDVNNNITNIYIG